MDLENLTLKFNMLRQPFSCNKSNIDNSYDPPLFVIFYFHPELKNGHVRWTIDAASRLVVGRNTIFFARIYPVEKSVAIAALTWRFLLSVVSLFSFQDSRVDKDIAQIYLNQFKVQKFKFKILHYFSNSINWLNQIQTTRKFVLSASHCMLHKPLEFFNI